MSRSLSKFEILISVNGQVSRHRVGHGPIVIGRSPDCDIVLNTNLVSRKHITVDIHEDSVYLVDMRSTNGVKIEGQPIPPDSAIEIDPEEDIELGESGKVFVKIETTQREKLSLANSLEQFKDTFQKTTQMVSSQLENRKRVLQKAHDDARQLSKENRKEIKALKESAMHEILRYRQDSKKEIEDQRNLAQKQGDKLVADLKAVAAQDAEDIVEQSKRINEQLTLENEKIESEKVEKIQQVEDTKNQIRELETSARQAKEKSELANSQQIAIESNLTNAKIEYGDLKNNLDSEINELQNLLAKLSEEQKQTIDSFEILKLDHSKLVSDKTTVSKNLEDSQKGISSLSQEHSELINQLEKLKLKVAEYTEELDCLEELRQEAKQETQKYADKKMNHSEMESELHNLRDELEATKNISDQQLSEARAELKKVNTEFSIYKKQPKPPIPQKPSTPIVTPSAEDESAMNRRKALELKAQQESEEIQLQARKKAAEIILLAQQNAEKVILQRERERELELQRHSELEQTKTYENSNSPRGSRKKVGIAITLAAAILLYFAATQLFSASKSPNRQPASIDFDRNPSKNR